MGLSELRNDFNDYKVEIICDNTTEVVEATRLLVHAGVTHGSSGYSMRYMGMDTIPHNDVWRNVQAATGGYGYGIEYAMCAGPKSIPLSEVYERYGVPRVAVQDGDETCTDSELESFLAG